MCKKIIVDIEILIKNIARRPQMYIGNDVSLDNLYLYILGFLMNDILNNKKDTLEYKFNQNFNDWVKNYIEKNENIKLEYSSVNYVFYIKKVYKDKDIQVKKFFELCEKFFLELHEKESKI